MKTLAERLKIGREKAGMSQAQLAEKIINCTTICSQNREWRNSTTARIKEIAKVLGVSQKVVTTWY
ncbi:helix-turn-helix transcriptional regulator [Escherichia coli]